MQALVSLTVHVVSKAQLDKACDGGCIAGALIRLGLDQLLWAPIFISTFLASLLTLEVCLCRLRCSIGQAVPVLLLSSSGALRPACVAVTCQPVVSDTDKRTVLLMQLQLMA